MGRVPSAGATGPQEWSGSPPPVRAAPSRRHPRGRAAQLTGAVGPEKRVPAGGQSRHRFLRELGAGRPGDVDPHPHRVQRNEREHGQAPEQHVPLEIRRRAERTDDHDSEHGQEEPDQAAAGVHGITDEGTDGTAVSGGQISVPHPTGAPRRSLLPLGVPRAPCHLFAATSGIGGAASGSVRARRAPVGHGVTGADVDAAARCRRWAAIRTGAFSSPYPA
jgi:hypothetical protein